MSDNAEPTLPDPSEVLVLHGIEGGLWEVHTQGSIHFFDLDRGTVTRLPGPNSRLNINDVPRQIRSIEICAVGRGGYWTMKSTSPVIDFFWHRSTKINRIIRASGQAGDESE